MAWILLIIAGLFEVAFASCLGKAKETSGAESTYWFIGFLARLSVSMTLLYKATQTLPIGTAYAVWAGIGAVGTSLSGIFDVTAPATGARRIFTSGRIAWHIG